MKEVRKIEQREKSLSNSFLPKEGGGLVLGMAKKGLTKQEIYFVEDDVHSLIIGATRSGKTRCLVLQTISCYAANYSILTKSN